MARRGGKRRGSRPWKPGVRTLTSAAPRNARATESRACESCCQLFTPPPRFPNVLLCFQCYLGEKRYQKSLKRPQRPLRAVRPKFDDPVLLNEWLTPAEAQMVREAHAKRLPG